MKQNNKKKTWKAIVAVILVMVTLFSISTMVSAGFVEKVFEEVCELMMTSSSGTSDNCDHDKKGEHMVECGDCHQKYLESYYCSKCGQGHLPIGIPDHVCSTNN